MFLLSFFLLQPVGTTGLNLNVHTSVTCVTSKRKLKLSTLNTCRIHIQMNKYCGKLFQTTNSLFKHERSHLYLNHKCQQCPYQAQFPYQLQQHQCTHTQQNMWMCAHCDKVFACKSSRNTHEQGHNINLKCQQCPDDTKKTFSSQTALNQHIRGQHGPGWTTFCQQTYKWKSKFSRHNSECKQCIKYKADLKLKRYAFLSHIALD